MVVNHILAQIKGVIKQHSCFFQHW